MVTNASRRMRAPRGGEPYQCIRPVLRKVALLACVVVLAILGDLWSAEHASGLTHLEDFRPFQGAPSEPFVPAPDHVVVVIMENHSYSAIIGSAAAPYINSLAQQGALFTDSHAITHPSEPNYLALFSGTTEDLTDDSCPHTYLADNLADELSEMGLTFGGYAEDLPSIGYSGCASGAYVRTHAPWVNFPNVPSDANRPFTSFPVDYSALPTVSIVIPNLGNDMHDGTIEEGDSWLQQHIDGYAQWAATHGSLLIVTWDEDDGTGDNHIPTIFVGPMVTPGQYGETITHYNVLRTLEDMYGLPHAGNSETATPITDIWQQAPIAGLAPVLGLSVNKTTFGPGETLQIDVSAANSGAGSLVDVYLGALLPAEAGPMFGCPGGDAIALVTNGAGIAVTCLSAVAQSFLPLARNVSIAAGLSMTRLRDFFSFTWTPEIPGGTYTVFVALTRPGTPDILVLATATLSFIP